jgi:hypothetical protein
MDLAFSERQKKAKAIAKINKIEQDDRPCLNGGANTVRNSHRGESFQIFNRF